MGEIQVFCPGGHFESLDRNLPAWTGICPLLSGHFHVHVDRNLPAFFFLVSACPTFDLLVLFFKFARFFLNLPAFFEFSRLYTRTRVCPLFLVMACPTFDFEFDEGEVMEPPKKKSRFVTVSEVELDELDRKRVPDSTRKTTQKWIKALTEYCKDKGVTCDLSTIGKERAR